MRITAWHMSVMVVLALLLHGGVALWLSVPVPEIVPEPPQKRLQVSLLAVVAETTTTAAEPVAPPEPVPPAKPKPEPKPEPVAPPKPKPEPLPEPVIETPTPVAKPVEPLPSPPLESVPAPEVVPPSPVEPVIAPLDAVASAKYEQLLVAWLEKHKKYPRRAKRMRIEGEGKLRILIDRAGRTQRIEWVQRTGNRLLDKAALEMAERANPFPPMPENDPRQALEFIVPVAFVLR